MKLLKRKPTSLKKQLVDCIKKFIKYVKNKPSQFTVISFSSFLFILFTYQLISPIFTHYSYKLSSANQLLSQSSPIMAKKIQYDSKNQRYAFNNGLKAGPETASATAAQVSITTYKNAAKGLTINDPVNDINLSFKPQFGLAEGKQTDNRIIYPLSNKSGWLVYTIQGTGVKEDLVLSKSSSDKLSFNYQIELGDSLEARLEKDGGVGIYGNTILSGNVTASTASDQALLAKARKNAKKDTLLFVIPKPVVVESSSKNSKTVKATYSIAGNILTVNVSGLDKTTYPISIDPSIYVVTAQQFMNGNNETNIDFDVANKLIKKSATTGARFDTWNTTTELTTGSWGGGTAAAGGRVYTAGGTSFSGKIYNTQGSDTFTVPAGVTSITVKMWGGGGAGGAGAASAAGGAGGGAGYVGATFSVTEDETLNIYVGGGGTGGTRNTSGGGGGGGGYSSLYRSTTPLAIAAGGGGGGGARATNVGTAGGAGGGTSGAAGTTTGSVTGGGGGTSSAGGAAGTGGNNPGTAGSSLTGGAGADGRTSAGADGSGSAGGLATGGDGGVVVSTTRAAGGGGGGGYYGGGGGSGSTNATSGTGGGGGSSYTAAGATSVTNTAGSGMTPGNSGDSYRGTAGNGGAGGAATAAGTNGSNGLVVITYGTGGSSVSQSLSWAQFNVNTGTIDSADPGSGACSGWCTTAAYNLPAARTNLSLVAYNGFLYAIGGVDGSGNRQNSVYIAKLGANGEPQLWHPTSTDKSTWTYWYTDTNLSSIRSDASVVAYNNRMYLLGGRSTSGTPVNTMEIADIKPTGTLGTWTASTNLPYNVYGHSAQVYNDRLYLIGGASTVGGAPLSNVYYNKINSDGTLNTWVQTTSFTTGRIANGGNISVVWGAYIYISGGCSTVNASGYCTSISSDTQVASINADGSIDVWNYLGNISNQRMGFGMIAWRNHIYEIGGCSTQNTTTGDCNSGMLSSIIYGNVNQDGDASTVGQSVASGTAPCSGTGPTQCNLPGTTYIGNMLNSTIITNGYLYVIGGCTNNGCTTTLGSVAYVSISSTGTIAKPATCPNGSYQGGAWCVDTVNTISGGNGAASPVVFGGRLYLVGGLDGSANTGDLVRTTINNDGSISAWTVQTLSSLGVNSVSFLYAFARANPSAASTNPGNLYILGGCTSSSGAGCTAYSQNVYKCNIQAAGAIANCSTSGQLQIGIVPGDTAVGLGIMSGTTYANYIYLIGGVTPNQVDLKTLRYAEIDNNNNIVAVSGSSWVESPQQMAIGRRRSAAFGYNGYIYTVGGYEASSGVLADIEFIKVNVSDGSLGSATDGFHVSEVQINQRWGLSVPISNSFAYVIGGCTTGASPSGCTVRTDVIQTFQIYNNDSGAPAGYTTSANTYTTSANRIGASAAVLNGYLYVAGGCTSATDCTTAINDISYTQISATGSLGTWSSTTAALPAVRAWGKLKVAGGSLYYMGGQSSTATDWRTEVYYATPSSGQITSWGTASNGLPAARSQFGAAVWNNRLYVVGGKGTGTGCTSNVCNTVYVSPQLNNGGNITSAWSSTSTGFSVARSGTAVVAYANNLYIFGGTDGTNYFSDSQFAKISTSDGTISSWNNSESLPMQLTHADAFAANGYIYLMGGRSSATTCDPVTLITPVSANTTISSGNNPTGIGAWYETNQRFTGSRYGAAAAYYDGKAYVMGGACGATLTYASPVTQQTTLLSQPQVAKYSIMIDTDSDVFPNYWLLNGVDNSIGARWQLKYRSMTNTTTSCTSPAMTTWGSETNFGDVTLGLPGVYTPKNGSGVSTSCARFYYFNVTVDSSQAFGYPDDVSRGPTITDLTLQFTADPSKRLMHGRTFVGGLQQPVDTPYYTY